MAEEKKQSIRVIDSQIDPKSKRGIRVTFGEGNKDAERFMFPLNGNEKPEFYEGLKLLNVAFVPNILNYVSAGGKKYALTSADEGDLLSDLKEEMKPKTVLDICRDIIECVGDVNARGYSFGGFNSDDILIKSEGLIMPQPSYRATEENKVRDLASVGGVCAELLTGITYSFGNEVSADQLPSRVPANLKRVIVNSTSRDLGRIYRSADNMLLDLNSKVRATKDGDAVKTSHSDGFNEVDDIEAPDMRDAKRGSVKRPDKSNKNGKRTLVLVSAIVAFMAGASLLAFLAFSLFGDGGADNTATKGYDEHIEAAYTSINEGKYEEARAELALAREENNERYSSYYYEALSYYKAEDYESTVNFVQDNILKKSFELAEGEDAFTGNTYYIFGCACYMTGDYENALSKLETAVDKNFEGEEAYRIMAICAIKLDNETKLDEVMRSGKLGNGGTAYADAVTLEEAGSYNTAAEKYYEASSLFTDREITDFCVLKTIECYIDVKDYTSAVNACDNALSGSITKTFAIEIWEHKANAYLESAKEGKEDYKNAATSFEALLSLTGDGAKQEYYLHAGECYISLEMTDKAKTMLTKASEGSDETIVTKAKALMEANNLN